MKKKELNKKKIKCPVCKKVMFKLGYGTHKAMHEKREWRNSFVVTKDTKRICGHLGCKGAILRTEGLYFWSEICEICGWGAGGSK